jgi:lipoate-protein ligase B
MNLNLATRLRLRLQTTLSSYASTRRPGKPRNSQPASLYRASQVTTRNSHHETWLCVELPVIEYQKARDLQSYLVSARKDKIIDSDIILILEHPPVFTLGRRGGLENLSVSESFLEKSGIPVIHVERGGDITFHGPGQIIAYPIINLEKARLAVIDYVSNLEEVMIQRRSTGTA